MEKQQGKTALITGASSGLGKEFTKIHAQSGGDAIIVARSVDKLNELKNELERLFNVNIHVIKQDLSLPHAGEHIYKQVHSQGLKVDYLINNAGFGGIGKFHERNWKDDFNMIQVNIVALAELTHYFLQDMVKRNQGKILNISSTASMVPGPLQAVYYASKAFVSSFSYAINQELQQSNVTVTTLLPGPTNTNFGKLSGMDKTSIFDKTADPQSVAQKGYEAMLNGKLKLVAGIPLSEKAIMAASTIAPKRMVLKQVQKMQKTNE